MGRPKCPSSRLERLQKAASETRPARVWGVWHVLYPKRETEMGLSVYLLRVLSATDAARRTHEEFLTNYCIQILQTGCGLLHSALDLYAP